MSAGARFKIGRSGRVVIYRRPMQVLQAHVPGGTWACLGLSHDNVTVSTARDPKWHSLYMETGLLYSEPKAERMRDVDRLEVRYLRAAAPNSDRSMHVVYGHAPQMALDEHCQSYGAKAVVEQNDRLRPHTHALEIVTIALPQVAKLIGHRAAGHSSRFLLRDFRLPACFRPGSLELFRTSL